MTFSIDRANGHTVLAFDGDLDSAEVQDVRLEADAIIGDGKPVIFDLSRVEFIDSSGVGLIVHVYRSLTARSVKVAVRGAQGQPLELLKATQLDRFLAFTDTLEDARTAIGAA